MEQAGEFLIPATKSEVWEALQNPDVLAECILGCESMTLAAAGVYEASIIARFGPVKSTFHATIEIKDANPPSSYTLVVNATGGNAGFGNGEANVALEEAEGGTLLKYDAQGTVGGKLAQIGNRLIQGVTRKLANRFFETFAARWNENS